MSEVCSNGLKPRRFAANFMIECRRELIADDSRTRMNDVARLAEVSSAMDFASTIK
jgi:hypothetical protein